jgi:hypothetical protein
LDLQAVISSCNISSCVYLLIPSLKCHLQPLAFKAFMRYFSAESNTGSAAHPYQIQAVLSQANIKTEPPNYFYPACGQTSKTDKRPWRSIFCGMIKELEWVKK